LRKSALWLIGILMALDFWGAAYLRELWHERHPDLTASAPQRSAPLNSSEGSQASPGSRISEGR
jgi:hypothetical protein